MIRGLTLHLLVLVLALGGAWATWRAPEDKKEKEETVLFELEVADISEVHYRSDEGEVIARPYPDGKEVAWAVNLSRMVAEKPPKGDSADRVEEKLEVEGTPASDAGTEALAEPQKTLQKFVFPAGRTLAKAIESMAPFAVTRELTDVPSERLEAMELSAPKASLALTFKGKTERFDVGGKTYGGSKRYLKAANGHVLLVDAAMVRGFEGNESRLSERRLITTPVEDITSVAVMAGGKQRVFLHQEREQSKKRFFAPEDQPEERSEEAGAVIEGLRRLRAQSFLADDAAPSKEPIAASFILSRADGEQVKVAVHQPLEGEAMVVIGRWRAKVAEGLVKALLENALSALP